MKSQIITAIGFAVVAAVLVTGLTSSVFGQGNMTGGNMTGGNMTGGNMTAGTTGGDMSTANGEDGENGNGDNGDGGDNGEEDDGEGSN
ncbi:MAG: hypothetical protein ACRD5J_14730 [Nitrososphaeraceae archaeon]